MKRQLLTVCLLASVAGAGRAESSPQAEAEVAAPSVPLRADLQARQQVLEERRKALEAEFSQLAAEVEAEAKQVEAEAKQQVEAEARQVDPTGRLTSSQLYSLLQQREARLAEQHFNPAPVVVTVLFGGLLTGFLAWLFAAHRKMRQLHETVRLMVEKGAEIPAGLLAPVPRRKPSDLRRGIILSTSGLGLTVFLAALPDVSGAWGAGVTLLTIGLGHLLVWRLQQGKGTLAASLAPELHS